MAYCTECGTTLEETARFCQSCGVPRHSDSASHSESSQRSTENDQVPLPDVERRDKFRFLRLLGFGFAVIFGGELVFAVLLLIDVSFPVVISILFAALVAIKLFDNAMKNRRNKKDGQGAR